MKESREQLLRGDQPAETSNPVFQGDYPRYGLAERSPEPMTQ